LPNKDNISFVYQNRSTLSLNKTDFIRKCNLFLSTNNMYAKIDLSKNIDINFQSILYSSDNKVIGSFYGKDDIIVLVKTCEWVFDHK
jgi:hypothetical protein